MARWTERLQLEVQCRLRNRRWWWLDRLGERTRASGTEWALDRLVRRVPDFALAEFRTAHGGTDGISADQHPLIGRHGPEGLVLQCGMSGTGFKIAPAVGLCMSELILAGESKTVDISIYRPERFAEGKEITGNYESIWH